MVPTRRRASLRRALHGLAVQEHPGVPWDVVVVDNDDPPGTVSRAAAAELAALPVPARVVIEPVLGASSARNRGIAEADGAVVALLDDDVVPAPDWLACLVAPILAGRCDGAGGKVVLDPSVALPGWLPPWMHGYLAAYDPADAEVDLTDLPPGTIDEPYVLTASAAFTAEVLARSGGFDPRLGPRAGAPIVNDDVHLCRRVLALGGRIRYVPAAEVVHELPDHRLTRRYLLRRIYAQGRSDWLLDRQRLGELRTAGVRTAFERMARELALVGRSRGLRPHLTFVWASLARSGGFLHEAATHLRSRGAGSGTGPRSTPP